MSYKARTFTREEFRKVIAAAIYDYAHTPAKCLYTTKDAADQLYGEYGDFRVYIYAMSLKRLKRKCGRYAKRERKAIEYVTTLKEES